MSLTNNARALTACHEALQVLVWHVIRLSEDRPSVREELERALSDFKKAIDRFEGT